MRYIGEENMFNNSINISLSYKDIDKFIDDALIEIYSRIRILLTHFLIGDEEIQTIKHFCSKIGYNEHDALTMIRKTNTNTRIKEQCVKFLEWMLRKLLYYLAKRKIYVDNPFMPTVTYWVGKSIQPPGGYISNNIFNEKCISDDTIITNKNENISKNFVGLCVDYLTRFIIEKDKERAFEIPLRGFEEMPVDIREKFCPFVTKDELLKDINGLDDISIKRMCMLCCFDRYWRNGIIGREDVLSCYPNERTIYNIRIMVERTCSLIESYGGIADYGFTFEGGYTKKIQAGDGDFITKDTLWDLKVSRMNDINAVWTLQVIVYWIMGQHSNISKYKDIDKIGIFNARNNKAYVANVCDIPKDIILDIEDDIIGYDREICFDDESVAISNKRMERLKKALEYYDS